MHFCKSLVFQDPLFGIRSEFSLSQFWKFLCDLFALFRRGKSVDSEVLHRTPRCDWEKLFKESFRGQLNYFGPPNHCNKVQWPSFILFRLPRATALSAVKQRRLRAGKGEQLRILRLTQNYARELEGSFCPNGFGSKRWPTRGPQVLVDFSLSNRAFGYFFLSFSQINNMQFCLSASLL